MAQPGGLRRPLRGAEKRDQDPKQLRALVRCGPAVLRQPVEPGQYVSIRYSERLKEAGLEPSAGSVGDSYDNALAETINGLYKAEVIHRKPSWRSREEVE